MVTRQDMLQAVRFYPAQAHPRNYLAACRWLAGEQAMLTETVHMVVPQGWGGSWDKVVSQTVARCLCERTRLLLPRPGRHRPFRAGTMHPLHLGESQKAYLTPHGGGCQAALMELYWSPHVDGFGAKLQVVESPFELSALVSYSVAQLVQGFEIVEGVTGMQLAVHQGDVLIPLAVVVGVAAKGVDIIPDAAMQLYFPGDGQIADGCDCLS